MTLRGRRERGEPARAGLAGVFALPGYPSMFVSRSANAVSQAFATILMLLLVARASNDGTVEVAAMWLAGRLPAILIGPFVGVVVDRLPKRHAMMAALWVQAAAVALLSLHPSFVGYLVANFVVVAGFNLFNQAQGALLPEMAPDVALLQRATAMNRTTSDGAAALGYALSGVALVGGAAVAALRLCAALYLLGSIPLLVAPIAADRVSRGGMRVPYWRGLRRGVAAVLERPIAMRLQLALALTAVLSGAVNTVLVLVPHEVAHAATLWYSPLEAAQATTMLLFGLVLAGGLAVRRSLLVGLSLATMGIGVAGIAVSPAVGWDFVWFPVLGVGNVTLLAILLTVYRRAFPLDVRGRAIGVNTMTVNGAQILGIAAGGAVAQMAGVPVDLLVCGGLWVAMGLTSLVRPWIPTEVAPSPPATQEAGG
jgi:DHA3 family macrolide efflux protein-like MFS transporter